MSEIKTVMKTFLVDMICDECNWGRMRVTGKTLLSCPPLYTHVCDRCGTEKNYSVSYPFYKQESV